MSDNKGGCLGGLFGGNCFDDDMIWIIIILIIIVCCFCGNHDGKSC